MGVLNIKWCNIFNDHLKKIFNHRFRTYDNPNTNIKNATNFCFLQLCALMINHKKLAIVDNSIHRVIIQELNDDNYKDLIISKPKIFNINQLYKEQIDLWNKLQNEYFNNFTNNYDIFIKKIKKELKKK